MVSEFSDRENPAPHTHHLSQRNTSQVKCGTEIRFNGCQRNESLIPKFAERKYQGGEKYLNTLPSRGGGWRKKRPNENETKVRHEGRNGGEVRRKSAGT
ncbi:hypothetical protein TNCV_472851 [Trichonephila clavipes]|nr:hypothetical protein TNCV_472851 [Trichonephila clavipes]